MTWKDPQTQWWETNVKIIEGSPHVAELDIVIRPFEKFPQPINSITDLAYVAGMVYRAEHVVLKEVSNSVIYKLLSKDKCQFVWHRHNFKDLCFSVSDYVKI